MAKELENVSFYSNPKERQCQNNVQITMQVCSFKHASKVMLKILQARLQKYENQEFPNVQVDFLEKSGTRDQIVNIHWTLEKAKVFPPKKSTSASFIMLKP